MIEYRLTADDVARIRFAFSPLWELVLSLIVLRAPAQHALHLPWLLTVRPRLEPLDLSELFALVPVRGIVADFLSPPPTSPLPDLDAELDVVARTSATQVLADVADVPGVPPAVRQRIADDPSGSVQRIVATLRTYWDLALAPSWPRIRTLLEADVLWRTRRLAAGGAEALFADLHESVRWQAGRVTAEDPWAYAGELSGEGLLLIPSMMTWPRVRKMVEPYQPAIAYPARAVGTLWESGQPPASGALASLLGRTRAQLLTALAEPTTTTALARRFARTPGAISQHLAVLLANGLVSRTRVDAAVLYVRSAHGDALVAGGVGSGRPTWRPHGRGKQGRRSGPVELGTPPAPDERRV